MVPLTFEVILCSLSWACTVYSCQNCHFSVALTLNNPLSCGFMSSQRSGRHTKWCGAFKRLGFFGFSHERSRSTNVKHIVFFHPHFANGELERGEQLAALIVYALICADNIDVWKRERCKKCKAVWTEPSNDCNQKHTNQSDIWCWLELSERSLTHRSQGKSTFLLRISAISTNLQMSGQTDPLWINRLWWQTCATGKAWFLFQEVVFVSETYCSGLNPVNSNFTALKGSAHPHYKKTILSLSISVVSGNANNFHFIC